MSFKEQLKEYFSFTKGETKGIAVLLLLLFFAILFNVFSPYFGKKADYDFSNYNNLLAQINDSVVHLQQVEKKDTLQPVLFNPNKLSLSLAQKIGLSEARFNNIKKYIAAGGIFKYKSDFFKIYGIDKDKFAYLQDYIDLPEKQIAEKDKFPEKKELSEYKKTQKNAYFNFNPNTLDDAGWLQLGFSEKQIRSIRKYMNKGGKFEKKEDLKKLYVLSDEKYADLEAYIIIPVEKKDSLSQVQKRKKVDINNATAAQLKDLGRFWQYNGSRIIKYRDLLGGFYKKEQLLEVYGVKKAYYDKVKDDIIIDKSKLKKIDINFSEVSDLGKHPYISYDDAKKILNFRNAFGFIDNPEILKKKQIISDKVYEKIHPYIKVKRP